MPEIPHTYSSTRNNDDQTIMIGNMYGHDDSGVILVNTQTAGKKISLSLARPGRAPARAARTQ